MTRALLATLALMSGAAFADAPTANSAAPIGRIHQFSRIRCNDALGIALSVCTTTGGCAKIDCAIESMLSVVATPEQQEQIAALLRERQTPKRPVKLVVHLLTENPGDGAQEKLPPDAIKALKDLESVIPNRRYALVDSVVVQSDGATPAQFVIGDVDGKFQIDQPPGDPDRIALRYFSLRGGHVLIETSLSLKLGETVVLGSSAGRAPGSSTVALLTAIKDGRAEPAPTR